MTSIKEWQKNDHILSTVCQNKLFKGNYIKLNEIDKKRF